MSDDVTTSAATAPSPGPAPKQEPPTRYAAIAAAHAGDEAAREVVRTRQMAVAGGVGAGTALQLYEDAQRLLHYWFPTQPEELWSILLTLAAIALTGGGLGALRRNEL